MRNDVADAHGPLWSTMVGEGPVLATAIHNGSFRRAEVEAASALDPSAKRREEDPHTGDLASVVDRTVVLHRSRFEVDVNRPRERAVYRKPSDAWDLDLWHHPPADELVADSHGIYDRFYAEMRAHIESMIERHGRFVVYDVHSYNHRRGGPSAAHDPVELNPVVNLGTRTLPSRWRGVADTFMSSMATSTVTGEAIDTRENVRFKGGHLSAWIDEEYGDYGCALAVEFKKVFMDEWTGEVHPEVLDGLREALAGTLEPVVAALFAAR